MRLSYLLVGRISRGRIEKVVVIMRLSYLLVGRISRVHGRIDKVVVITRLSYLLDVRNCQVGLSY
jgi:hypothetical protein